MSVIINNFRTLSKGWSHLIVIKCCTLDMTTSADIYFNTHIAQSTISLNIHGVRRDTSSLIKSSNWTTYCHTAIILRRSPTCTKGSITQHGLTITGITRT